MTRATLKLHRYNPELLDPWENHVAVITRGWRDALSPNHTYELGHSTTYVPAVLMSHITLCCGADRLSHCV
jgi:hypothetical protein